MLRAVIQFLFCVGVLPFYPLVLLLAFAVFTPRFWSEVSSFTLENWAFFLIYPAGAIGVPALFISILAAPAKIKRTRWLRVFVIAGLLGGSLAALAFLAVGVPADVANRDWPSRWMGMWQFGGPLVVALWNGWRLWREPNPLPEPRALSGT